MVNGYSTLPIEIISITQRKSDNEIHITINARPKAGPKHIDISFTVEDQTNKKQNK